MNSPSNIILSLLLDPNVIFLLFIVALIGVFVEVAHPGAIIPGVVGSIALILFLFGASFLSPNWAGLVFMTLAFVLLLLDVKLPAHGILTLGAVISLITGAFLFFNGGQSSQGPQLNPILVFAMGGLVGIVGLYIVTLVVRTRRRSVKTGTDSMIGTIVITSTPLQPVGRVNYKGEDWTAVLDDPSTSVDPGTEVQIVGVEGLLVHVQPVVDKLSDSAPTYIEGSYKEEFHGSHCGAYHRSTSDNNFAHAPFLGYTCSTAIRAWRDFCTWKIDRSERAWDILSATICHAYD